MVYKVLESSGEAIENTDGAAFNNALVGGKDGIISGILSECRVISASSSEISITTGEILIHGVRVKITSPYTYRFYSTPASDQEYLLIGAITFLTKGTVSFSITIAPPRELTQSPVYDSSSITSSANTYEVEIGRFTYKVDSGVTNPKRTLPFIEVSSVSKTDIQKLQDQIDQKEPKVIISGPPYINQQTPIVISSGTQYDLGTRLFVTLNLPEGIDDGYECLINFYSGSPGTVFDCPKEIVFTQDDCIDGVFYPTTYRMYEISIKKVMGLLVARVGGLDYVAFK